MMPSPGAAEPPLAANLPEPVAATGDELETLRRFGVRRTWPSGATLLQQGERPESLFVIEHGRVALWDEAGERRRLVQVVQAGASIGDLPVLLEEPCLYTAVARDETVTLGFTRETVHALLQVDPEICFLWLRLLSRRITASYPRNVALAGRSAIERIGLFLLSEVRTNDSPTIDLTHADLASATGLSRQQVSRVLGLLERLGVVERGRGKIRVLDTDQLRALLPR